MKPGFGYLRAVFVFVPLGIMLVLPAAGMAQPPTTPDADLRADVDRDGTIAVNGGSDEAREALWSESRGAILLPNLDDDAERCKAKGPGGRPLSDKALAACNDAADTKINGSDDAADLAPLRIAAWPEAPDGARVTVKAGGRSQGKVRFFVRRGEGFVAVGKGGNLNLADLRNGAELGAEARDIVRDPRLWDGYVNVTLTVNVGQQQATDRVRMRVSPVIFQHDLMPTTRLMAAPPGEDEEIRPQAAAGSEESQKGKSLDPESTSRSTKEEDSAEEFGKLLQKGERQFLDDIGVAATEADVPEGLDLLKGARGDIWAQDLFQPAYASMPAVDGGQQTVRIMVRSANTDLLKRDRLQLRRAGRTIYTDLRGSGIGAIQQFSAGWAKKNGQQDTYNSTGNWGATPPYETENDNFPNGRLIYGSAPGDRPDPSFVRMMRAQGAQPPIVMDTSWLSVGHIDEFVSFLPADNERGWVVSVADPRGALEVLRKAQSSGNGEAKMLEGLKREQFNKSGSKVIPAERTVNEVLASRKIAEANNSAAHDIDRNLNILRDQLGLKEDEIVRTPVLFKPTNFGGEKKATALLPNAVNGVHLADGILLTAHQHGPTVEGRDLMEEAVNEALDETGVQTRWIEDYYYAHIGEGNVHCVTNTLRDLSETSAWWSRSIEPKGAARKE